MNTQNQELIGRKSHGRFDPEVICRYLGASDEVWTKLHLQANSRHISADGKAVLNQAIGAMHLHGLALLLNGRKHFRTPQDRQTLIGGLVANSDAKHFVVQDACLRVTTLAHRRDAVVRRISDRRALRALSESFWTIVDTGVLTQLPLAMRYPDVHEQVHHRAAKVLRTLWDKLATFSKMESLPQNARTLCAQALGLEIFRGVRMQRQERELADSVEALVEWDTRHVTKRVRNLRGTYAQGIHELAKLAQALGEVSTATDRVERKVVQKCEQTIRQSIYELVLSGIISPPIM